MILSIQCPATKRADAWRLVGAGDKPVVFVADPESSPRDGGALYARPDDIAGSGGSFASAHILSTTSTA